MHAKYEVSISYGSKVIAKVKVDNRQTNRQTDRQDKNNMPPIIRSGGIKKVSLRNDCFNFWWMEILYTALNSPSLIFAL